ncbi:unnamed protein product [Caenorhabditis auriculariae]|uniref:Galectin n=1 Tax=Caenorhabditis auriculariae TaxID=2777116 RepID=A0A8S1H484_9PELO|nr:unnamed protein product [Caenorhabditis auriculariae]
MSPFQVFFLLGLATSAYAAGFSCKDLPSPVAGVHEGVKAFPVELQRRFQIGDYIVIHAKLGPISKPNKRFWLDLFPGTSPVYSRTPSMLHLNAQFDRNKLYIAKFNGTHHLPYKTIRIPFSDDPFVLSIRATKRGYLVQKDGVKLFEIPCRKNACRRVQTVYLQNLDLAVGGGSGCGATLECTRGGKKDHLQTVLESGVVKSLNGICK